jgi:hypothetical protein
MMPFKDPGRQAEYMRKKRAEKKAARDIYETIEMMENSKEEVHP